eukprot:CCRYP_015952-RD/>CCRYP_015952-RD protein AED:0.49 eAED:0.49 QI:0/-1/0/1/-1/0/1/0/25
MQELSIILCSLVSVPSQVNKHKLQC